MRKIILGVAVSLDGYIEGPSGEFDWCFTDQDYGMSEFLQRVDASIIGRRSYELVQSMGDPPESGLPKLKEYVFSNSLSKVKDGAVLVRGDLKEEVNKIKNSAGKDIWLFGGAELTSSMMREGLVDELWLSIHPIILGGGKPLFINIKDRQLLTFRSVKSYDTGLLSVSYSVNKK